MRTPPSPNRPSNPAKIEKAQNDLEHRGTRNSQPDKKEPPGHPAHEIRDRNSDQKSRGNTLEHDKPGSPEPVVKPDKAEQEAGQQAVDTVSLQIIKAGGDDIKIRGEGPTEQVSVEKGQPKLAASRGGDHAHIHPALLSASTGFLIIT